MVLSHDALAIRVPSGENATEVTLSSCPFKAFSVMPRAVSQIRTVWQLYAVFAGLGVAMAAALYEPATAVIVSWFDPARRPNRHR